MNPTKTLASLALAASMLFAGACAQDLTQDKPGSTLTQLSNGPDLPEECNVCWDDFQDCFAEGNDLGQCGADITDCAEQCQAPPPPSDCLHCAAGFDACVTAAGADGSDPNTAGNGDAAADCAAGFEGCLFACETQDQCDNDPASCEPCAWPTPGGDPTTGGGEDGQDPGNQGGEEGQGPGDQPGGDNGQGPDDNGNFCDPTDPPISECEQCDIQFNECFDDMWQEPNPADDENGQPVHLCDEQRQDCYSQCDSNPFPDDQCEVLWQECADGSNDQGLPGMGCEDYIEQCEPGQTPPDGQPDDNGQSDDPNQP